MNGVKEIIVYKNDRSMMKVMRYRTKEFKVVMEESNNDVIKEICKEYNK